MNEIKIDKGAMLKIDKDVPIPMRGSWQGLGRKYPFEEMEVGDSFFVTDVSPKSVRTSANGWKKRHPGFDYTSRVIDGGTRVWRIG